MMYCAYGSKMLIPKWIVGKLNITKFALIFGTLPLI